MKRDFDWDKELEYRRGAQSNLLGIDVFVDFDWARKVGHPQTHFINGRCLARRIRKDCPDGKRPCLLLTDRDGVRERSFASESFYVVVVNFDRYRDLASADASAAYFGDSIGTGLTRLNQIEAVVGNSPEDLEAFFDLKLTPDLAVEWATRDVDRLTEMRHRIGDRPTDAAAAPSVPEVLKVLRSIDDLSAEEAEAVRGLLADSDGRRLVDLLIARDLVPADLIRGIDHHRRCKAVGQLEEMLAEDLTEGPWQRWFEENSWVLGSDYVGVLDERSIDVRHIADYLMEAYDGFLDLIEIKRPEGGLKFWADVRDHGNLVPHADLIKALTQAARYLFEVERESDSTKFLERTGGIRVIKPRCVLIFGRSTGWGDDEREAYRLLNASYHNLNVLTFDHVLARAQRILGVETDQG